MPLTQVGQYDIRVTSYSGAIHAHLDTATCTRLKWEANGFGSGQIVVPLREPNLSELIDPDGNVLDKREIQVYLNSDYLATLVPAPKSSPSLLTIDGMGPAYHLKRRYIGRLDEQPNLAENPTFETDLSDWTASSGTTAARVATPAQVSTGAVQLDASTVGDHYLFQDITVPSQPFDTFIWITAWLNVAAGVAPQDLVQGRSLFTTWKIGSTLVWQQGSRADWRIIGSWQPLKLKVFVPAGNTYTMQLRLYVPVGTVYYDEIVVHREERLYLTGDPGTIICGLVNHAQNTAIDKADANIGCTNVGSGTAALTPRGYKYAERANIMAAMGEMQSIEGGVDWVLESDGFTRDIVTYERTGLTDDPEIRLLWDTTDLNVDTNQSNIADWQWTWNPDTRADQIIVGGRGSGDDLTEARYDDPDSDLGWEWVKITTPEATPRPRDQADGYGQSYKRPINLRVTVHRTHFFDPAVLISNKILWPCKTVWVTINEGPIAVDERFKIVDIELAPEPDTATMSLVSVVPLTPGAIPTPEPEECEFMYEQTCETDPLDPGFWLPIDNVDTFTLDTNGELVGSGSWAIVSLAAGDTTVSSEGRITFTFDPFDQRDDEDISVRFWAVSPDGPLDLAIDVEYQDGTFATTGTEARTLADVTTTPTKFTIGDLHTPATTQRMIVHFTFTATAGGQTMFLDNVGFNVGANNFCFDGADTV